VPFLNTVEAWAYRLFGNTAPKFLGGAFEMKAYLEKAGIKIYPQTYLSLMFFFALLSFPVTIASLVLLYFFKFIPLIFLVPTPLYVLIGCIIWPMSMASDRATNLEREIPFAATYVTVMASGGIPPYTSFKRLSDVAVMPAMRKEAQEIVRDVEVLGVDPLSALDRSAKKNPLDIFRDFTSGYASTVVIGGDVNHFLETKTQDIFKTRSARVKIAADRLGMLLESFVIIMVLMSLCFYILFSVESIYSVGASMYSGMIMYTYVFTPLLSFVFIYLANGMQPRTPITDWRPYKLFLISGAAGLLLICLLSGFFGMASTPFADLIDLPTAVAICLFITVAPPAVLAEKYHRQKSGIERGLAIFLEDLTETRKTGLAPERCIETLAKRDYGEFSTHLSEITTKLTWGVPVRKAVMGFVKKTKSWLSQIVMFLLIETIDVGGGTVAMIEALARFNTMTQQVEKEKTMSIRPYIFVPYFASILLVATTLMTLMFTSKTLAIADTITMDLEHITTIFTISVIIHSYLIGLVAGKIGEESVALGFKHSAILVILAIVAAKVVPVFLA